MKLFNTCKLFVPVAAFFAVSCVAKITTDSGTNLSKLRLVEAAVQILETCYENRATAMGLAGNSTDLIIRSLWSRGYPQVALISSSSGFTVKNRTKTVRIHPETRHKLQMFVVSASSSTTLTSTLKVIRSSVWWNHLAVFVILDWSTLSRRCGEAREILWSAWKMNILKVNYFCLREVEETTESLIYTFNPYTSHAPSPWQIRRIYPGKNNHPWTLFARSHEDVKDVCENLDFEKTNDLGGYEIRVSVTSFGPERPGGTSGRTCFGVYEEMHCQVLFRALNATPKVLVHDSLSSIGYVDEWGNPHGILAEVITGSSDIGLTGRFLTTLENMAFAYPHWHCEIRALTQFTGFKSQLSKIRSVVDGTSRSGLCLVLVMTILFFRYFNHETLTVAHLNTVRVICNSTLPRMPKRVAPRIYLGSLFLFALTIQGIYQGKFASLLTKQETLRNVNTMNDLVDLGHTIYGFRNYRVHFDDPELQGRFVGLPKVICTDHALTDPRAACVGAISDLIYDAATFDLHVSRDTLASIYEAFPIRPDWPLEERVNRVIRRSLESYWMQHIYDNVTYRTYKAIELQEARKEDHRAKVLTLEQLTFAFAILGVGLGLAALSFGLEIGAGGIFRGVLKMIWRYFFIKEN